MRFSTLDQWLQWQETLHPKKIELGLGRVSRVWRDIFPSGQLPFRVITVAGTNGKGSSVAFLEAMLLAAGYRVGCFTSPHLVRYNERIRMNGSDVESQRICAAFERIDQIRRQTSLTYFEFSALAALEIFSDEKPDVVVLEVGLGGRLDATNIIDADVALITTIGLDHTAWLGETREQIALEKAGIMRPRRPVVFSGGNMPLAIGECAEKSQAPLYVADREYRFENTADRWAWWHGGAGYTGLPLPTMPGGYQLGNAAGAIMALELLRPVLEVSRAAIEQGLVSASIAGRFQIVGDRPLAILDVAHNGQAAEMLAENLRLHACTGRSRAVFGIMGDKDLDSVVAPMRSYIDQWYLADLRVPRALQPERLRRRLIDCGVDADTISCYQDVSDAWSTAVAASDGADRVLAFGSFWLVGELISLHRC